MSRLFGTDGIRGQANIFPITAEIALQTGKALAKMLDETQISASKRVLIGKDTRLSGYMLETALTSGLVAMGKDVYLVGPVPTPALAHLTKSMAAAAGIMLTASHNPSEDNGIKIFGPDAFKLNDELEQLVETNVLDNCPACDHINAHAIGKAHRIEDARGRYIEFAKSTISNQSLEGLKVVLDCANGASYFLGPLIFKELGAEVIPSANTPDGLNINHECGALHPEKAGALVQETGADIGISFDGDADRVIFTDDTGTIVDGDRILGLCALELKKQGRLSGNTLVTTCMSNLGLIEAMKEHDINVATTQVGDRHVIEEMQRCGYTLGGEKSGHVIFLDYVSTGDGIITALQVLKMMKQHNASLRNLTDFMHEYPQKMININVREKKKLEDLSDLQAALANCRDALGEQGRTLVRYSGTENKLRVLVEAWQGDVTAYWADHLAEVARQEIGV